MTTNTLKKRPQKYTQRLLVTAFLSGSIAYAQQNVLLIIADDLGADSVGLYSSADTAPTPTIDSLATGGVRFTNAWANPSCTPTRSCILTGRYGIRTGVGWPGDQVPQGEFTIPQALDTVGYATACIGKWHLSGNTNGGDDNPNLMGYDHYEGAISGSVSSYTNWTKVTNGNTTQETNYATSETVDNAISWIDNQGTDPWFCQLAFNAPHSPFHKPPNDLHSSDSLSGTNRHIRNNGDLYYKAMIEAMDTEMDRLLDSIDPAVLANTNIIFIGDNGTPNDVSPGVVRDAKGSLYEGGVHVPFIVKGPIVSGSLNRTNSSPIHVVDIFETVLEMAGVNLNTALPSDVAFDSVSIVDYLSDENQDNYHAFSYTERFRDPVVAADGKTIRNEEYKLVAYDNSGAEEMYHISSDPTEANDLLDGSLSADEQANYDYLSDALTSITNGGEIIDYATFEEDWGIWNDGGSDASRNGSYPNSGALAVRLRDNSGTSVITTDTLDLSNYSSISVTFSYYVVSFDNANEDFFLEISTDGGSSYSTIGSWNRDDEFVNDERKSGNVTYSGTVNANTKFRFRCDASGNSDWVHIDDVIISGE